MLECGLLPPRRTPLSPTARTVKGVFLVLLFQDLPDGLYGTFGPPGFANAPFRRPLRARPLGAKATPTPKHYVDYSQRSSLRTGDLGTDSLALVTDPDRVAPTRSCWPRRTSRRAGYLVVVPTRMAPGGRTHLAHLDARVARRSRQKATERSEHWIVGLTARAG